MAKQASFAPVRRTDGYLPLSDYGLIGDGSTAALVGRDGRIDWMCVPRFDAPALFCGVLDARRGGCFEVAPEQLRESRQFYDGDTGILQTEMRADAGVIRVTDALTLRNGADLCEADPAGRHELLRSVRVLDGTVRLRVRVDPRGGAEANRRASGLRIECAGRSDIELHLSSSRELDGLNSVVELRQGDSLDLLLRWEGGPRVHSLSTAEDLLTATATAWKSWVRHFRYDGPQTDLVRRSAITLKLLDYFPSGAIVAAPTSSFPEAIGGPRNWDYRYTWVRDAAFSVYALRRIGLSKEAWYFLAWVLDSCERDGRPMVLYDLDGAQPPDEVEDNELEGYRKSPPVRWGNGAADQTQNDAFGEVLDCAYQWVEGGGEMDEQLWRIIHDSVEQARKKWHEPDHGIWEVRTEGRTFTYTAALCQVALDRGAKIAERLELKGDVEGWRKEAERIRNAILKEAWDDKRQALTEHLGGGAMDASVLSLPLRRVIAADHPRMVSTTEAVVRELSPKEGLVYRYDPDISPDGLPGHEGVFLLCSFWLVDNLAHQGRLDEAGAMYEQLCGLANPIGLLPEQLDPDTGEFLGNFPQAFSHVGVISSGVNLARSMRGS